MTITTDIITQGVGAYASTVYAYGTSVARIHPAAAALVSGFAYATNIGNAKASGLSDTAAILSGTAGHLAGVFVYDVLAGSTIAVGSVAAAPLVASILVSAAVGTIVAEAYNQNMNVPGTNFGVKDFVDGYIDVASQEYEAASSFLNQKISEMGDAIGSKLSEWGDELENLTSGQAYEDFLKTDVAADLGDILIDLGLDDAIDWGSNLLDKVSDLWNNFFGYSSGDSGEPGEGNPGSPGDGGDGDGSPTPGSGDSGGSGISFPNPLGGALGPLGGLFDNPPYCPLVFDLDGSGNIELTSLANSNAFFDMDSDGFAEFAARSIISNQEIFI